MKKILKSYWFFLILAIFIVVNSVLIINNFIMKEKRDYLTKEEKEENFDKKIAQINLNNKINNKEYYNFPCPNISKDTISGEKINLRDLAGNVIIIRFSRFWRQDLPNLLYLEHLANKFRDQGVFLLFINSLGKHYEKSVNKVISLSSPIIEDDGSISKKLNAHPEEILIIDRHFTIKLKYHLASKSLIYNQLMKWIFEDKSKPESVSKEELVRLFKELSFFDVIKNKKMNLINTKEKYILLTLFTSACTGCKENIRIRILKEISSEINPEKVKVAFLFGKGNNPQAIRRYALLNKWDAYQIRIGIFEDIFDNSDYYKIFQLDLDPKTFILDAKGKVIFAENRKNSHLLGPKYLRKILK